MCELLRLFLSAPEAMRLPTRLRRFDSRPTGSQSKPLTKPWLCVISPASVVSSIDSGKVSVASRSFLLRYRAVPVTWGMQERYAIDHTPS
ncbi:hypothetical protein CC79DRAFT_1330014 [Sarocladium strictum]